MSNYSTGELAKLCNVTTRTIQYYDRKGILKPARFTEGNRRLYTEEQQQTVLNKISNIQHYVSDESKSPISHLKDIENVMSKSVEMKSIRRSIWISAGIMGVIQYSSIISALLMKNKWPFIIALPFMIGYGIGITLYYQRKVAYLCPSCQHVFSPSLWQVIKAKHTATTRRFECPNCHETHYCIEVPKTHSNSETFYTSQV